MIGRAGWVLIVVAAIACKERKEPTPYVAPASGSGSGAAPASGSGSGTTAAPATATPATTVEPGRLFSEAEITALLDDLMKRLDATAKRTCAAPQVQATTTSGTSAELLVELFEAKGDFTACITRLGELGKNDLRATVTAKLPEVMAFEKECGGKIAAQLAAAAARTDGCSPYQVGVRAEPKSMLAPIQIAHIVGLHARELAAKGDIVGAVAVSINALRVYQDLARGHINFLTAMIAHACTEIVSTNLDAILDTAKLPGATRTSAAAHLDALIGAMPRWADILAGERDSMDIHFGAADLMPATWSPPGGWNEDLKPRTGKDNYPAKRFGHPRDEAAVLLVVTAENAADQTKACPASATLADCQAGIAKLGGETKTTPDDDLAKLYASLAVAAKSGDVDAARTQIRSQVVSILKAIGQGAGTAKYVGKFALSLGRLAELRIHVEAQTTCDAKKLATHGSPPYLGAPLDIRVLGTKVEVRPPAWTDDKKVWTFACAR